MSASTVVRAFALFYVFVLLARGLAVALTVDT